MLQVSSDLISRALDERRAEDDLYEFVKQAWPIVEPGVPFQPNWHLNVICDHLMAVSWGEIKRLLINIPPRHSKSSIVCVMWPVWEWIGDPTQKFLCSSYSATLSTRDALKSRRLIQSPWFQERWNDKFQLTGDQNVKARYDNDKTGYRIATSVGGSTTGDGGSRLIMDDPLSVADAQSDTIRESTLEWWDSTWSTRLNNPKQDAMVTIMQRLHEMDISGRILQLGGWEHVCVPAEWDGIKRKTCLGPYDPRTVKGSLLWPERLGQTELDQLKVQLGDYHYAGQFQQTPAPDGGGIINTTKFQLWPKDKPLPHFEYIVQAYDTAFTAKTTGDPTACGVWGLFHNNTTNKMCVLLLDTWAEHMTYPTLRSKVIDDWSAEYGIDDMTLMTRKRRADIALVENKGSGKALLDDLQTANIYVRAYDLPRGSQSELNKVARAHLVTPIIDANCVFILESKKNLGQPISWAKEFIRQCQLFPNAEHDDYVDTFTMTLFYLKESGWFDLKKAKEEEEPQEIDYEKLRKKKKNPYDS